MALMDSLVEWTWLRKESLSLGYDNRLSKLKSKEKKSEKKKTRKFKNGGTTTKGVKYA